MARTFSIAALALLITLTVQPVVAADQAKDARSEPTARPTLPETYFKAVSGMERLRNQQYFDLLAGQGLRSVDPKALFARIGAAVSAGENYKALYLARVFTTVQPETAAGWTNRAKIATALGFMQEAEASQANAVDGTAKAIVGGALPGAFTVRPSNLSDWAAAVALAADDITAREGRAVAVAVRDDLSGVTVASSEDIQRENRGPWASANPVAIDDVLPNLFVMAQATPMDRKSMKGGMFALGALALAGSTYSTAIGATDAATQLAEVYGNTMAKAFEVASDSKGGSYVAMTYTGGLPRKATINPKTAGKYEAVGTPITLLWASGPTMAPTISATWTNGDTSKTEAVKVDAKTKKQEWKKYQVPSLHYPRTQQFCATARECSSHLTLFEVMLSADDVRALSPGSETKLPNLSMWRDRYASRQPLSVTSAGAQFAGFDAAGTVYITRHRPTEWLTVNAAAPQVTKK